RDDEPEAVDEHGADQQGDAERGGIAQPDLGGDARQPDTENDQSGEDVDDLPDAYFADAHEHLCVLRLREGEVELPLSNVLDEPGHVRLDRGLDETSHENLDAEEAEQLGLRPAVQLV